MSREPAHEPPEPRRSETGHTERPETTTGRNVRAGHPRKRTRAAIALTGGTVIAGTALLLTPTLVAALTPHDTGPSADPVVPARQDRFSPPAPTAAQLARWRTFPADRAPRPLVVLGDLPKVVTPLDAVEKAAFAAHSFKPPRRLPSTTPRGIKVDLPEGHRQTYRAVSAGSAFAAMSAPTRMASPAGPIEITGAELGTATMPTDRGSVRVPSWIFHTARGGSLAWPALTPDAFWKLGRVRSSPSASDARADAVGTTLSVRMPLPPPACPGAPRQVHRPAVLESATAVVVGLTVAHPGPAAEATAPGCGVLDTDVLRTTVYEIRLARPLAGRILLYADGAPVPVTRGRA
ncbi:hypothetical protein AB0J52_03775 [Spirillospora sp. NPDC049652]